MQWLPGTTCKAIFEVNGDYKRYLGMVDDAAGFPSEISAEAVDGIDDLFAE